MHIFRVILLLGTILPLFAKELITPIPETIPYDHAKAALGKKLFRDPILSRDGTISCESCHHLDYNGADATPVSTGVEGRKGDLNSPTVFNAVFNFSQFWDGRAKDLKEQAIGPILNPKEMDSNLTEVVKRLRSDTFYRRAFYRIYQKRITIDQVAEVIAEYEKSLITPDSRFDRFLKGDKEALSDEEKEGYKLFKSFGCISCHNGVNIGGNLYQKIGIIQPYHPLKEYAGRYNITKNEEDRYYLKVPSLRNVALTAPYLHDGSVKTLDQAIKIMIHYQLGRLSKDEDVAKIEKFLHTLTGRLPENGEER